ncbi:peptidoglycan-binding protein [Clostridium beijerinckii]|uniref:peptidoglycan-binding protein n=1 Tax=Clostridium beijerinckii TaxID=1520 RepID=UPI00232C1512|nr:peptidoglycan-binding protein [Clostridium beijerinckii]
MKEKVCYPEKLDGIYGDGMKQYVIKFRKENSIKECTDINKEFYEKLGITLVD